jgi:hypothetical protein
MDMPENLTANSKTPLKFMKIQQNPVRRKFVKFDDAEDVSPRNTTSLQKVEVSRPKGFEPLTYGLEIRCSIQLSYGRKGF